MTEDRFSNILDQEIESPRFKEPVRVLRITRMGSRFTVHFVGIDSGQVYDLLLTADEINDLQPRESGATLRGDGARFKLAAEAWRIKLAHLHDPLLAVGVSKIDPLPHQLEAVYDAMLPQPALRFMLADDPGAGKTIMAGLLFKELKLRGVVRRTLIVAPSPLRAQWQREMREKFGERFDIIERATLQADGMDRAWNLRHQTIASMDFLKQPDVLDSLAYADGWDLVIVDEAHKMSAYAAGSGKVYRSQRNRLGQALSAKATRFLLMTATPHKGDPENFRLLLSLLDADLFANAEILQRAVARRENPIFLRRMKEDLRGFDHQPLFPGRQAITVPYRLQAHEMALYEAVDALCRAQFQSRAFGRESPCHLRPHRLAAAAGIQRARHSPVAGESTLAAAEPARRRPARSTAAAAKTARAARRGRRRTDRSRTLAAGRAGAALHRGAEYERAGARNRRAGGSHRPGAAGRSASTRTQTARAAGGHAAAGAGASRARSC